ncbi:iron uptake system protein EfeO [Brachybacterium huguangmaarense]
MTAVPTRRSLLRTGALSASVLAMGALAACTDNPRAGGASDGGAQAAGGPITVTITDDGLEMSATSMPAGQVTFEVTNSGTVPNEFEILADDQLRIISEQENIGPGTTVSVTTALAEGTCYAACKPNMVGELKGITELTITPGSAQAVDEDTAKLEEQAVTNYTAYIRDQVGLQVTATREFTDAYIGGNTELAKALFPQGRRPYERIEPTAEAFGVSEPGDLDVALDLRIQDLAADAGTSVTDPEVLAGWTGWHRIEADLFSADEAFRFPDDASRQAIAEQLNTDTQTLYDLVYGKIEGAGGAFAVTLTDVVNGASGLLNEVATGKIVGEEDTFSHTDLDDFQANVEGALVAWGNVAELVKAQDEDLAARIEEQFAEVQAELDQYKDGTTPDGGPHFVDYSTIAAVQKDAGEAPGDGDYTPQQRALSTKVNALSESLSKVAGTILH